MGFSSVASAVVAYLGSAAWFLLLVGVDVGCIVTSETNVALHAMMLSGNVALFLLQTLNVVVYQFRAWPVVSLYYAFQLWVLGLRALRAAKEVEWVHALVLFAQCLLTASQLSVTLEHLYRIAYRVQDTKSSRTTPSIAVRR